MFYLVEISYKPGFFDALGHSTKKSIQDMGISSINDVKTAQLYLLETSCQKKDIDFLAHELLADKITQKYKITALRSAHFALPHYERRETSDVLRATCDGIIQVWYKKGVTDAVGDTVKKGAADINIKGIRTCNTGFEYKINGKLSELQIEKICSGLLANKIIQEYIIK